MKRHSALAAAAALSILAPTTHQAFAQNPVRVPADLLALPRCVWTKVKTPERVPLVTATEAANASAIQAALTRLKADTLQEAVACSPSTNHDAATGDEVLLVGLRQEAAGDLLSRDLKLTRQQLDRAITAAPAPLSASLLRIAAQTETGKTPDAMPSLVPIVTGLHRPSSSAPLTAKQSQWLETYVLGHYKVRAAAASYDPEPKA